MAVITRDGKGIVKGLWFEKLKIIDMLTAKACTIYNACPIAGDKSSFKVLIESDCKVIVDAILGYLDCP